MRILYPIDSKEKEPQTYFVHHICFSAKNQIEYSICPSDEVGQLIFVSSKFVRVVQDRIPANWRTHFYDDGSVKLAPVEIVAEGFLEHILEPDRYPEACETVLRLQDPLRFMQIPASFLLRINDLSWNTIDLLRKNKWISISAVIEFAISKVQNEPVVPNEVVSIAALLPKDESQIEELLEGLAKKNAEGSEQRDIVFASLLAFIFESRDDFDDVIQAIEDLVARLGIPDAFEASLGSDFLDLPPNVLMKAVKRFLDSAVYMKLVER